MANATPNEDMCEGGGSPDAGEGGEGGSPPVPPAVVPVGGSDPPPSPPGDLAARLGRLESRQSADHAELDRVGAELAGLRRDEQRSREAADAAERLRREAEAYAEAMATERRHIVRERDQALLEGQAAAERLRLVRAALRNAKAERERVEAAYEEQLGQLRRDHNELNAQLQAWEQEIRQLRSANAALNRESAYLRETSFTGGRQSRDDNGGGQQEQQLRCFSCRGGYSVPPGGGGRSDNNAPAGGQEDCAFHPLPSVPPLVWHRWTEGPLADYRQSQQSEFTYWPCCNVLAARDRRPPGCRRGPHHQRWEMDVVMRRVMLDRAILDEEMEEDPQPTIYNN